MDKPLVPHLQWTDCVSASPRWSIIPRAKYKDNPRDLIKRCARRWHLIRRVSYKFNLALEVLYKLKSIDPFRYHGKMDGLELTWTHKQRGRHAFIHMNHLQVSSRAYYEKGHHQLSYPWTLANSLSGHFLLCLEYWVKTRVRELSIRSCIQGLW